LIIPISLLFVIYYAIVYAKIGVREDSLVLKVDNFGIFYNIKQPTKLFWKEIIQIKDQSFYYDFPENGPENKGWHHKIIIIYMNVDNSQKTLRIDHNLTHQNHELLLNYINELFHNEI